MDILTHTVSGIAVSSVVAAKANISLRSKFLLLFTGGLAAALPDVDAISLWSGFDQVFGKPLGLTHSGNQIYFSKFWYSHHGFMHSLAGAVLFGFLLALGIFVFKKKASGKSKIVFIYALTFVLSYAVHLVGDMPTPGSVWGGVNLFWPSDTYIGGFGKVWWWNNYDVFLIFCALVIINVSLIVVGSFAKFRAGWIAFGLFLISAGAILYQMESRPIDFSYAGHTNKYPLFEAKSLEIQKEILGEELFSIMNKFDNQLNIYF